MVASRVDVTRKLPLPVEHLRALLLRELAAHAAQASDRQTTTGDLTGQTDVDSVLEREIAEASAVRAADAIGDIEQALGRLDNGTYGSCERCEAPIPLERLEAIPHARECVACAGQHAGLLS
jgi:RNA polymerase-binding transcription factor DksA